ncbi:MAG TPA: hypothetical protein VEW42_00800 [Candidatus Eisenbacteria bacterium]|nr:hypothetical protein [Candidatus Eisenbacteria bacterium]
MVINVEGRDHEEHHDRRIKQVNLTVLTFDPQLEIKGVRLRANGALSTWDLGYRNGRDPFYRPEPGEGYRAGGPYSITYVNFLRIPGAIASAIGEARSRRRQPNAA